jgi:hypothetical protein
VVDLTLKHSFISKPIAFPIFDKQLFDAGQLLLISFVADLLPIRKVDSGVVSAWFGVI